jgi:eukaryotic-like serine/threonine-protein kinase
MRLSAGARLGPYEILSPLGAGGMGEVYRARDTRLGREVAIKVLPPEFSADVDRLRRFEKEARAASSLNHPNIVTIHEVERLDSTSFIVMELVAGKTLREIVSEGALPVRRLLTIAVQIAEGLARAHSAGIVHRDLKPENVMVTKDGLVKILDFGLAKLAHPELEGGELTQGPTVSGGTSPGVVMGTIGYMSPEQASGHPVDFRSDQFSFGSLLYEMATGKGPFRRATAAQTLAAIIQDDPEPVGAINAKIPPPLRWAIERCLAKDPRDRYASTEDLARDLAAIRNHLSEASFSGEAVPVAPIARRRLRYVVASVGVVAAIATAGYLLRRASKPPAPLPIRTSLLVPENKGVEHVAVSPDGRCLAFTTGDSLWVWNLDAEAPQRVTPPGTVDFTGHGGMPFWSPDGRFVAFFSDGKLKKVDAAGKTIQTICDSESGGGGAWGPDGMIVFAPSSTSALYRVSAAGGQPVALTKLNASRHERSHRNPYFLPDGRHFLYLATDLTSDDAPPNGIRVASLDGKLDKAVVPTAEGAAYASGHLIYVREDMLVARPFDLERLEAKGEPVPIAREAFRFGVSDRVLAVTHLTPKVRSALLWIDRSGKPAGEVGDPALFRSLRLSPDGRKVAVDVVDAVRSARDIWIYDVATGKRTKLVSGSPPKVYSPATPVWSPEGDRIAYMTYRKGRSTALLLKPIGGANEEILREDPAETWPDDWSSDGRYLAFGTLPTAGRRNFQLWTLTMDGDRRASAFATDAPIQENSRFSPDARWIAYTSDESGRFEVYVRSFPGPGGKWQVSNAGGSHPQWRRDGRELFYLSTDNRIMAVPVQLDRTAFRAGSPVPLFSVRLGQVSPEDSMYEVSADGQRFLVNSLSGEESPRTLTLISDWRGLVSKD